MVMKIFTEISLSQLRKTEGLDDMGSVDYDVEKGQ